MSIDKLTMTLSKYGHVQVIKEGEVFTLFMTGRDLSNWKKVKQISEDVLKKMGEKYPDIEVMKNTDTFFLLVLKSSASRKLLKQLADQTNHLEQLSTFIKERKCVVLQEYKLAGNEEDKVFPSAENAAYNIVLEKITELQKNQQ